MGAEEKQQAAILDFGSRVMTYGRVSASVPAGKIRRLSEKEGHDHASENGTGRDKGAAG